VHERDVSTGPIDCQLCADEDNGELDGTRLEMLIKQSEVFDSFRDAKPC